MCHRFSAIRHWINTAAGAVSVVGIALLAAEAAAQHYAPHQQCADGCDVLCTDTVGGDACCGSCNDGACGCGIDGGVADPCDCGSCATCRTPSGFWIEADYLLLWTKGMNTPALATTGTNAGEGVLGADGTQVLFGGTNLLDGDSPGGRFTLGQWNSPAQNSGFEFTYLFIDEKSDSFSATEDDFDVLARPFTNITDSVEDSRLIALDGVVEGSLSIDAESEFDLFDAVYTKCFSRGASHRADLLFGYRYAELNDSIRINESTTSLDDATAGTEFDLTDRFATENTFHGALLGARVRKHYSGCWSWDASFKIALGGTERESVVSGQTVTTDPADDSTTTAGGLLTQQSNIGTTVEDGFGTVSELGLTLRRRLRHNAEFSVGYVLIAWQDVYRAGEQIDTNINTTQIPPGALTGPAQPTTQAASTGYWAQGLRLGITGTF